jgi:hypothetical protein
MSETYYWTRDDVRFAHRIERNGKLVGLVTLTPDLPFHSAILNDICELLRRYETNELAD